LSGISEIYIDKLIAIIDYKAGNLKSVERALKKLGFSCCITHNNEEILTLKGSSFQE